MDTEIRPTEPIEGQRLSTGFVALVAAIIVFGMFTLTWHVGYDLGDEGFLWDGVRKTLRGQIPLRDFVSYDPARYYWCAGFMSVFGGGVFSLRLGIAAFQFLGLFFGLLAVRDVVKTKMGLVAIGFLVAMWMLPRWKVFEPVAALIGIYVAVQLIQRTSMQRVFLAGIWVGVAALIGRNHGLYQAVAFFSLLLLLHSVLGVSGFLKHLLCWIGGIAVGYAPFLLMLAFIPGFWDANIHWVALQIWRGTTNLPLPVPWPWRVIALENALPWPVFLSRLCLGVFFVFVPVTVIVSLAAALKSPVARVRRNPLLLAGALLTLPYLHHAFARADVNHLAQGAIQGFLLCCVAGVGWKLKKVSALACRSATIGLLAMSILATLFVNPFGSMLFDSMYWKQPWVSYRIAGSQIRVPAAQADQMAVVESLVRDATTADCQLFIAPFEPGYYPVLGQTSPTFNSYLLFPEMPGSQQKMIRQLKERNVDFAMIWQCKLDGRPELCFQKTHPLIWTYLQTEFREVSHALGPDRQFLERIDRPAHHIEAARN
jgi:hypothetical protein